MSILLANATGSNESNETTTCNPYSDAYYSLFMGAYAPWTITLDKYATITFLILAVIGNPISAIVWLKPRLRHSSGLYLAAISIADTVNVVVVFLGELTRVWLIPVIQSPVVCRLYPILSYAPQYLKPMLILAFTAERYIAISYPFKRESWCTPAMAVKVIASLTCLSFAIAAPEAYFWMFSEEVGECDMNPDADGSFHLAWSTVSVAITFFCCPFLMLAVNLALIREMKRLNDYEKSLLNNQHRQAKSATTLMLLVVSFFLIITSVPIAIVFCVKTYEMKSGFASMLCGLPLEEALVDENWLKMGRLQMWDQVAQETYLLHSATPIFIYIITGRIFREECEAFILGLCGRTSRKALRSRQMSIAPPAFTRQRSSRPPTTSSLATDGGADPTCQMRLLPQSPPDLETSVEVKTDTNLEF